MTMIQFWPNLTADGQINPGRFIGVPSGKPWTGFEVKAADEDTIVGVSGLDTRSGTVTDNVGVTLDDPLHADSGEGIRLQMGHVLTVEAGSAITPGQFIGSDGSGRATTPTTGPTLGIALEQAIAAGEFVKFHWQPRG